MSTFYSLPVSKITKLTNNSVAVTFAVPENLMDTFSFEAGQYITIKHMISGKEVRRAYSISTSPNEGEITVGIKKVLDGTFSVFANTSLKEGDVLEVMPPEGRFVFTPGSSTQHIAAFAAGSGITPIMSIAKTVLDDHSKSTFVLVYGNKTIADAMFHEELSTLTTKYPERFFIQFVYSRAHESNGLFGRIENATV
ncbi:MAG: flavodoxin reductase, partial [Eudoraea sp.]|nr:flavodoxin reductase [Eudoraea sp.]